ncbi:permease [Lachnospiraceae bacterium 62-26]
MEYMKGIIISCCSNTLFLIFCIILLGYMIGKISIKGISLGSAGIFLTALIFGHFGYADTSLLHRIGLITTDSSVLKDSMNLLQNLGLLCFVTSVGFIAGPNFFHNLRKNAKSYVLLAFIIIGSGSLACIAIIYLTKIDASMAAGLLSGALTTTPGFAAAQDVVRADEFLLNEVTVGHAIGYPFGVIGVVLFVQLVPKLLKADISEEQKKIQPVSVERTKNPLQKPLIEMDPIGLGAFSLAVILGILLGKVSIPLPGKAVFSLGNTGGALIIGLLLGHFGRIGQVSMKASHGFLKSFREFGLIIFLVGAGVPGGSGFADVIRQYGLVLFLYGAIMTLFPLLAGYLFAKYVVKLCLFNNLGSITGGMTSTPALGALINTAQTDDVASSYAATYPAALVLIVLASQFIVTFL